MRTKPKRILTDDPELIACHLIVTWLREKPSYYQRAALEFLHAHGEWLREAKP